MASVGIRARRAGADLIGICQLTPSAPSCLCAECRRWHFARGAQFFTRRILHLVEAVSFHRVGGQRATSVEGDVEATDHHAVGNAGSPWVCAGIGPCAVPSDPGDERQPPLELMCPGRRSRCCRPARLTVIGELKMVTLPGPAGCAAVFGTLRHVRLRSPRLVVTSSECIAESLPAELMAPTQELRR